MPHSLACFAAAACSLFVAHGAVQCADSDVVVLIDGSPGFSEAFGGYPVGYSALYGFLINWVREMPLGVRTGFVQHSPTTQGVVLYDDPQAAVAALKALRTAFGTVPGHQDDPPPVAPALDVAAELLTASQQRRQRLVITFCTDEVGAVPPGSNAAAFLADPRVTFFSVLINDNSAASNESFLPLASPPVLDHYVAAPLSSVPQLLSGFCSDFDVPNDSPEEVDLPPSDTDKGVDPPPDTEGSDGSLVLILAIVLGVFLALGIALAVWKGRSASSSADSVSLKDFLNTLDSDIAMTEYSPDQSTIKDVTSSTYATGSI